VADQAIAYFVRFVAVTEDIESLANTCKALTWEYECEHAILRLSDGRRILVRGGRLGINLECVGSRDPFGRPESSLWVNVAGDIHQIGELILHTHPMPTGPSDADLLVLELLEQTESLLFEIFGPIEGTIIRPKRKR